jgi:hypothetical protein
MVLTPAKDSIDVAIPVEDIKRSLAFYQVMRAMTMPVRFTTP